jgi:hypothetical protein
VQTAPCCLQHLGERAEYIPRQACLADTSGCARLHKRIFGITTIMCTPKSGHRRDDAFAGREGAIRARCDNPGRFDPQNARELDAWRVALTRCEGCVSVDLREGAISHSLNISDRFTPAAITLMSTSPALGVGTGSSSSLRTSGSPGSYTTTARIVFGILAGIISKGCAEKGVAGFWGRSGRRGAALSAAGCSCDCCDAMPEMLSGASAHWAVSWW